MQTNINLYQVPTRDGALCLYANNEALSADARRPVLLMIHGALRDSSVLFDWIQLCDSECDVVFVDLPGHGRSPAIANVTIESFAENVGDAVTAVLGNRAVVVVGESLGGLVALAMSVLDIKSIQGVVAADPPMTMAKLWHVRNAISSAVASNPDNQFWQSLAINIFGVGADGKSHERIYYDLVQQAHVPVLILTGDVPLFPVRNVNAVPCLLDDVDRYVLRRFAGDSVQIEVVPGCGHVLLVDAKEKCRSIIGKFCDALRASVNKNLASESGAKTRR